MLQQECVHEDKAQLVYTPPVDKMSGYIIITMSFNSCLHLNMPINACEFMQDLPITSNTKRKLVWSSFDKFQVSFHVKSCDYTLIASSHKPFPQGFLKVST